MKKILGRITYFESIALLDLSHEPIMAFDNFLNEHTGQFNINKQKECMKKRIFSDEEMKYLLYIYSLMKNLYIKKRIEHDKGEIDIWKDWSLQDKQVLEIKKWIIKFLSLSSMKEDMDIIRRNPYYKGIGDFY